MGRFAILKTDDSLLLVQSNERRHFVAGCVMFFISSICISLLGLLSLVEEMNPAHTGSSFTPQGNHFGFLWLVGCIAMIVFLPLYILAGKRSGLVYGFNYTTGLFTRNGKLITRLPKIEYVQVQTTHDPDDRPAYRLSVFYGDGYEIALDEDYDEYAIREMAQEIAKFTEVRLVWKRSDLRIGLP